MCAGLLKIMDEFSQNFRATNNQLDFEDDLNPNPGTRGNSCHVTPFSRLKKHFVNILWKLFGHPKQWFALS